MSKRILNNKEYGSDVRSKINENFTDLYNHSNGSIKNSDIHGIRINESKLEYNDGENWVGVKLNGQDVKIDSSNFDGNLDIEVTDLQKLAEKLDEMESSGDGSVSPTLEKQLREHSRLLTHHEALFDIDGRAMPNTGKFYDLFDGHNTRSVGRLDTTMAFVSNDLSAGDTLIETQLPKVGDLTDILEYDTNRRHITVSNTGKFLLVMSDDATYIEVLDASAYELIDTIYALDDRIFDSGWMTQVRISEPVFSRDDSYVAIRYSGSSPNRIVIYNTENWNLVHDYLPGTGSYNDIEFSLDNSFFYLLNALAGPRIVDMETLETLGNLNVPTITGGGVSNASMWKLKLSPDGDKLAVVFRGLSPDRSYLSILNTEDNSFDKRITLDNSIHLRGSKPSWLNSDNIITKKQSIQHIDIVNLSSSAVSTLSGSVSSNTREYLTPDNRFYIISGFNSGLIEVLDTEDDFQSVDIVDLSHLSTNIRTGISFFGGHKKLFASPGSGEQPGVYVYDFSTLYAVPDFANGAEATVYSQDAIENVRVLNVDENDITITPLQHSHSGEIALFRSIGEIRNGSMKFHSPNDEVCYLRYNITAPLGLVKEIVAWIERDSGLDVNCDISMINEGEDENFLPMDKETLNTEDQFTGGSFEAKEKVALRITMSRSSTDNDLGINRILGAIAPLEV